MGSSDTEVFFYFANKSEGLFAEINYRDFLCSFLKAANGLLSFARLLSRHFNWRVSSSQLFFIIFDLFKAKITEDREEKICSMDQRPKRNEVTCVEG